jgi:hypothetical protein
LLSLRLAGSVVNNCRRLLHIIIHLVRV